MIWKPTPLTWNRMFKATQLKQDFAKQLLERMTPAELRLWAELCKENVGPACRPICPWKPQVVVKGWIVDFYNNYTLTAIEVDGLIHAHQEQAERDAIKDASLRHFGLRVIRVSNDTVLADPALFLRQINGFE